MLPAFGKKMKTNKQIVEELIKKVSRPAGDATRKRLSCQKKKKKRSQTQKQLQTTLEGNGKILYEFANINRAVFIKYWKNHGQTF